MKVVGETCVVGGDGGSISDAEGSEIRSAMKHCTVVTCYSLSWFLNRRPRLRKKQQTSTHEDLNRPINRISLYSPRDDATKGMRFYIAPEEGEMAEAEHRGQLEQGKEELEWGRGSAENGVLSGVDVDKPKGAQKQGGTGTKNGSESTRTHPTHNDGPNDKPSAKPSPSPSPAPSAAPITSPVSPQSDVSSSSESPSDSETPRPSRTSISLFSRLSSESGGSLHDSRRSAYEALPSPARHDAPSETPGIGEPQQLTTACVGMPTAALTPEWAAEREGKSAVGQPTESSNSGSSCWTASEYEPSCSESTDAGVPIAQPCTIAEAKLFDSKLMNGDYATTRSTGRGAGGSTTTSSSSCSDNVPMAYPLDSDYSSEGTSPLDDLRQITRSFSERCGSGGARSSRWRAAARLSVDFGSSPAASPQLPRKALPPKLLAVVPRSGAEPSFAGTAERSGSVITRTRPLARVSPREGLGSAAQANRRIQRRFSSPGRPQTAARKAPLMDGEDRVCATQIVDDRRSQALHERVRINRIARRDFGPIRHVSSSPVLLARNASERASPREAAEGGGDRGGGGEALPGVGKGGREWRAGDAARILNAVAGASAGMMAVGVDGKRTVPRTPRSTEVVFPFREGQTRPVVQQTGYHLTSPNSLRKTSRNSSCRLPLSRSASSSTFTGASLNVHGSALRCHRRSTSAALAGSPTTRFSTTPQVLRRASKQCNPSSPSRQLEHGNSRGHNLKVKRPGMLFDFLNEEEEGIPEEKRSKDRVTGGPGSGKPCLQSSSTILEAGFPKRHEQQQLPVECKSVKWHGAPLTLPTPDCCIQAPWDDSPLFQSPRDECSLSDNVPTCPVAIQPSQVPASSTQAPCTGNGFWSIPSARTNVADMASSQSYGALKGGTQQLERAKSKEIGEVKLKSTSERRVSFSKVIRVRRIIADCKGNEGLLLTMN